jgi:hypothetical protein
LGFIKFSILRVLALMNNEISPWHTAHTLLKQFDCANSTPIDCPASDLREAVLRLAHHSDYQILGICANSREEAIASLQAYSRALGYQPSLPLESVAGAVYLKFNPVSGLCYVDSYTGQHRGVVLACQSADAADVNHTYGHLPLNLFD